MHSTWNIADFRQRQIVLYYFMIEATSSLASSSHSSVFQKMAKVSLKRILWKATKILTKKVNILVNVKNETNLWFANTVTIEEQAWPKASLAVADNKRWLLQNWARFLLEHTTLPHFNLVLGFILFYGVATFMAKSKSAGLGWSNTVVVLLHGHFVFLSVRSSQESFSNSKLLPCPSFIQTGNRCWKTAHRTNHHSLSTSIWNLFFQPKWRHLKELNES